ncbi:MAG: radical SAM family heme chaperone HemW [Tannerellaceae bacterium]|jgi:oxygen-independent coproporphyrinogen-3 oxidase|nr:radical SAM family heme chaperone HemW [Tannerellaceae bacterium]
MAGLYIHIPFCAKRCRYCDFFSTVGKSQTEAFTTAVCKELEIRKNYLHGEPVDTIYFGGGTPSQLTAAELSRIFDTVFQHFHISDGAEITLEANPDDMSREYVASLFPLPINRISMGVQSFSDEELRLLGRRHSSEQAKRAVELCRDSGYHNISIDLMYGLPMQTMQHWEKTLEKTIAMDVPHLSAYHLTYEECTPLYRLLKTGSIREVDETTSEAMFNLLIDRLTVAGYEHYEISNFARPGRMSRHNSSYWSGKKYLGAGPSAHSYDIETREWNISSLDEYIDGILRGAPVVEREKAHGYNEYVMTGLRTCWGISVKTINDRYGENASRYFLEQAEPYIRAGMLEIKGDTHCLTRSALFVSDSIISALLQVDSYTKHGL